MHTQPEAQEVGLVLVEDCIGEESIVLSSARRLSIRLRGWDFSLKIMTALNMILAYYFPANNLAEMAWLYMVETTAAKLRHGTCRASAALVQRAVHRRSSLRPRPMQ